MPAAWFAALLARHSALQTAADFCWAKAKYDGAIVAKTIPQIVAMDNVLICESYVACWLFGRLQHPKKRTRSQSLAPS
jgi:hypothetical protein